MTVRVYTRPSCTACDQTKRLLTVQNTEFETIDVSENLDIAQRLVDQGYRAMPVVEILENGQVVDSWSGLKVPRIKELA